MVRVYNGIQLSHKKYSKVVPFAATYMQLEIITLSEVNQKDKEKYQFTSTNPKLPFLPSPTHLPLGNPQSILYVPDFVSVS